MKLSEIRSRAATLRNSAEELHDEAIERLVIATDRWLESDAGNEYQACVDKLSEAIDALVEVENWE